MPSNRNRANQDSDRPRRAVPERAAYPPLDPIPVISPERLFAMPVSPGWTTGTSLTGLARAVSETNPQTNKCVQGVEYERFNFPVGECHVRIEQNVSVDYAGRIDLIFNYKSDGDLIELLLVVDALKRRGGGVNGLTIPYMPFSRQDRVAVKGEPFSLAVVATLINSIEARHVRVYDPHSDVLGALIKNLVVVTQHEIFAPYFPDDGDFYLVSPDGGALKKIYALASKVKNLGVVECSKKRNTSTGEITGVRVNYDGSLAGKRLIIVDDICDGGRTFVEIGKVLKDLGARDVSLMVTHGFFTKGLGVFDNIVDHIWTRHGVVK